LGSKTFPKKKPLQTLNCFDVFDVFYRFRRKVMEELSEFVSSKVSLHAAFFLAVSTAFIIQTDNSWVTLVAEAFAVIAVILILTFLFAA
jgi:hypothetical protein